MPERNTSSFHTLFLLVLLFFVQRKKSVQTNKQKDEAVEQQYFLFDFTFYISFSRMNYTELLAL